MHRVVLATHNGKKLAELRRILERAGLDAEVVGLDEIGQYAEPAETERTFEGNALIKARAAAAATGERPSRSLTPPPHPPLKKKHVS